MPLIRDFATHLHLSIRPTQAEGPGPRGPEGVNMGDMSAIIALQKAERLVSTVARAFYTDNTVLVVDTLIREK